MGKKDPFGMKEFKTKPNERGWKLYPYDIWSELPQETRKQMLKSRKK